MKYPAHPLLLASLPAALALGSRETPDLGSGVLLKEEAITIEYTASADEASIIIVAESETDLERLEIEDPSGAIILDVRADGPHGLALTGIELQTEEGDLNSILTTYPPGVYRFQGTTIDGVRTYGRATLSHVVPRTPLVTYPLEDSDDVPVDGLTVSWIHVPDARSYRLSLEQDDTDKIVVRLPAGATSFQVPDGLLDGGTETQFELIALGELGNTTGIEVEFETQ